MKKIRLSQLPIVLFFGVAWFLGGCGRVPKGSEKASEHEPVPPSEIVSHDSRPIIVSFGDSLTAGAGVDPSLNYPSQLQKRIDAEGYRYRVLNAGVSGETSSQGLDRVQAIIDIRPSIAIVELGANDGLRGLPVSATRQNLETIIRRFLSAGVKVVLAGMQVPPNYGPQYVGAFRNIFKDVAKQYRIPLIPFFLEGVGGNAALNQDDGIHPTAEGYKIVTENVLKVLQPLLRARTEKSTAGSGTGSAASLPFRLLILEAFVYALPC